MLPRIAQVTAALTWLKPVWNDRSICLSFKIQLIRPLVTSIFLYACESCTLTAELQRIQAMEMGCYPKILRISYKDHVTNDEVRAKIQRATGPHEGGRRQGRQRKRWEDNIKKWTGWSSPNAREQWRTEKNGGNWL